MKVHSKSNYKQIVQKVQIHIVRCQQFVLPKPNIVMNFHNCSDIFWEIW